MSFSKAIIGSSPRGVNLLAEVDIYYPLQSKISDWFPMKRKKPVVLVAVAPAKPKIDHDAVENGIEYESAPPVLDRYYTSVSVYAFVKNRIKKKTLNNYEIKDQ